MRIPAVSYALWRVGSTETSLTFFFAPPSHHRSARRQSTPSRQEPTPSGPANVHSAAKLTLREWFATYYRPWFLVRRKANTIAEYGYTLARWERLTSNPPLHKITGELLMAWRARLCETPGNHAPQISAATANKHLCALLAILTKAGPPGLRNRDALGHLNRIPWIAPLRELEPTPRHIEIEQLERIYKACAQALHPIAQAVNPEHWWQAWILIAYTCALRRGALLGITWENANLAKRTLTIPANIDKTGRQRLKPITPEALRHLLRIQTGSGPIFPWPHSASTLNREWHHLQTAAGIPKPQQFTIHDLKRTAATEASATASPWTLQRFLDHANISTSLHYVAVPAELRDLAERLPLPPSACA